MNVRDIIKYSIDTGKMVSMAYVEDLSDSDLMRRPHPGCNHIKWQMGHLIVSENQMIEGVAPGSMPALPSGFAARYTKETAGSNDPAAFDSKAELLRVFEQQRAGTLAALAKLPDAAFDKPSPESMQGYAPTVATAFDMQGAHWLMHVGQWVIVRRELGRPPLF